MEMYEICDKRHFPRGKLIHVHVEWKVFKTGNKSELCKILLMIFNPVYSIVYVNSSLFLLVMTDALLLVIEHKRGTC